jgi:hypothetical protein
MPSTYSIPSEDEQQGRRKKAFSTKLNPILVVLLLLVKGPLHSGTQPKPTKQKFA